MAEKRYTGSDGSQVAFLAASDSEAELFVRKIQKLTDSKLIWEKQLSMPVIINKTPEKDEEVINAILKHSTCPELGHGKVIYTKKA